MCMPPLILYRLMENPAATTYVTVSIMTAQSRRDRGHYNMEQKTIRLLRADEIECRIGTISEKGVSLLLYKDARANMKILDEVYGPLNWQRKHEMIGSNLYCTVSVWDDGKKQWISKMDVGTESYTEKEKGQASFAEKFPLYSLSDENCFLVAAKVYGQDAHKAAEVFQAAQMNAYEWFKDAGFLTFPLAAVEVLAEEFPEMELALSLAVVEGSSVADAQLREVGVVPMTAAACAAR